MHYERVFRSKFGERCRDQIDQLLRRHTNHLCFRACGVCQRSQQVENCTRTHLLPRRGGVSCRRVRCPREEKSNADFPNGLSVMLNRQINPDSQRLDDIRRAAARMRRPVAVFRDPCARSRCDDCRRR